MKVKASQKVEVEIDKKELANAIMNVVLEKTGDLDDAGCDWVTDLDGFTYIGSKEWRISTNPVISTLVDAANILNYGQPLRVDA